MSAAPAQATAEELMTVLTGIRRVTRRRLREQLPGPRLRGAHVELLQIVAAEPGIGVAAAARGLHLAGNSVSTLVNQLADAGLLRREVDPADRRAARLFVTDAAVARMARWRESRRMLVGDALDRLPPGELAAIGAALPALRHLLSELAEEEDQ
ncbi:MarR family winged helix-turn-helix transcriptional regulator [Microbispora sp. ATCC PTA-5024]|uniref:MarR family winged helix-turn-helix transcriptional regulator n=1 Tax=Microbispora sp. ATCC PTA-5024 TaxID=316330 RepID=UPI0004183146|nr:MarR family winged helix-turn-helix transcriptional regulator [Microbispora sp. ATCC PTA-5024]